MALVNFISALQSQIADGTATISEGNLNFSSDGGRLYWDINDTTRIEVTDIIEVNTDADRLAISAPVGKFYYVIATNQLWKYTTQWVLVSGGALTADQVAYNNMVSLLQSLNVQDAIDEVTGRLNDKVASDGTYTDVIDISYADHTALELIAQSDPTHPFWTTLYSVSDDPADIITPTPDTIAWGGIIGNIANQGDLETILSGKLNIVNDYRPQVVDEGVTQDLAYTSDGFFLRLSIPNLNQNLTSTPWSILQGRTMSSVTLSANTDLGDWSIGPNGELIFPNFGQTYTNYTIDVRVSGTSAVAGNNSAELVADLYRQVAGTVASSRGAVLTNAAPNLSMKSIVFNTYTLDQTDPFIAGGVQIRLACGVQATATQVDIIISGNKH